MAERRTQSSIAAQMLCERIPLPAYGYQINPALALKVPRPAALWAVNKPEKKVSGG